MSFVAAELTLCPPAQHVFTVADAPYAHAAVLHAISAVDATVGQRLHNAQREKRLSIALLDPNPTTRRAPILRVVMLTDETMDGTNVVLEALSGQRVLQLGRAAVEVQDVAISGTPWSGVATWSDLLQDTTAPMMRFEFVTPTAIMKQDNHGQRFSALLPEPLDIFRGLARRWRELHGPPLPDTFDTMLQSGGCVVAHHRIQTKVFRTQERTQIGFIGTVTYQGRTQEPEYLRALNALARLAFFTGVGYQTARGMGLVQTTIEEDG